MVLEEALRENNELLKEHNSLLTQILGAAKTGKVAEKKAAAASDDDDADEADEKPAKRRGRPAKAAAAAADDEDAAPKKASAKKAAAADDDDEETAKPAKKGKALKTEDAINAVKTWVNEIEVEVDDEGDPIDTPANMKLFKKHQNRTAFVKKCLGNLGVTKTPELTDSDDIAKLIEWIEAKKAGNDPFADEDV